MLCPTCQAMFAGECKTAPNDLGRSRFKHHDSAALIELRALNGCYICSVLWNSFREDERTKLRDIRFRYGTAMLLRTRGAVLRFLHPVFNVWTPIIDLYSWHCIFPSTSSPQIIFDFGDPFTWACVKFDLLHPYGTSGPHYPPALAK